ncbi:MBL fold metallo-hydrolase [Halorubrum sp. SD626R]|uniref:MBL fold metallo-hydrolase n=1 Tax=Halorubrum TaxID=56688 RepID=UPI0010F8A1FE|nr:MULTISPECIES: MBL fold metallo-hydrolase [Halorubrum]TKX78461.1 MBL fold metallo-hydrolase [Halorubrum sp. SD626R]
MDETTVRFLGTGDPLGTGGRLQTSIHVDTGSTRLLVDCGASALSEMNRYDLDRNEVGTILLTHLHGDHFAGIPFFVLDAQFASDRTEPLTIVGPPGTESRVTEAMEVFFPGLSEVDQAFDIEFVEIEPGATTSVGPIDVRPYLADHPSGDPSYALRVEVDGSTVTYSGDTAWVDDLVDAAAGADLFVCEAYAFDADIPYHMTYTTFLEHEPEIDADRTILTHMSTTMFDRLDEVDHECATDGMVVEI